MYECDIIRHMQIYLMNITQETICFGEAVTNRNFRGSKVILMFPEFSCTLYIRQNAGFQLPILHIKKSTQKRDFFTLHEIILYIIIMDDINLFNLLNFTAHFPVEYL